MPRDTKVELLANVPLFAACTKKELRRVAALADRVFAQEGEVLAGEGKPGHDFFVIAQGSASVSLRGRRLATLGPGEFFGEMSLLDAEPRSATVRAEEGMILYVLDSQSFGDLLEDVPVVARKLLRGLAGRLRAAQKSPVY